MDDQVDNFDARNHAQSMAKIVTRTVAFTVIAVTALVAWRCDSGAAELEYELGHYKEDLSSCVEDKQEELNSCVEDKVRAERKLDAARYSESSCQAEFNVFKSMCTCDQQDVAWYYGYGY